MTRPTFEDNKRVRNPNQAKTHAGSMHTQKLCEAMLGCKI